MTDIPPVAILSTVEVAIAIFVYISGMSPARPVVMCGFQARYIEGRNRERRAHLAGQMASAHRGVPNRPGRRAPAGDLSPLDVSL